MAGKTHMILLFSEVDKRDVSIVGNKGANRGELVKADFSVPAGFILSSRAYFQFLNENNLIRKINQLLSTVQYDRPESLQQVANHIKKLIVSGEINHLLIQEIYKSYSDLDSLLKHAVVTITTSSASEGVQNQHFHGQLKTISGIQGESNLIIKIKESWASFFDAQALFYRKQEHVDHFRIGVALIIEKEINFDRSGIAFSIDPITLDKSKIVIEDNQNIPDHYVVSKPELKVLTKTVKISNKESEKEKLTNNQIITIAIMVKKLEHHNFFPQEVQWGLENNKLYILQTKSITTKQSQPISTSFQPSENLLLLLHGIAASPGMASGPVKKINTVTELSKISIGDILVTQEATLSYKAAMKKAAAIITDKGGHNSRAATLAREIGIPAVISTKNATNLLSNGTVVTVNGTQGKIYKGAPFSSKNKHMPQEHPSEIKTATHIGIEINTFLPRKASLTESIDGISLLQAEALFDENKKDRNDHQEKLVEKLAEICSITYPYPLLYQPTNRANENEKNSILGFHGAFRSIQEPELFTFELDLIKTVREKNDIQNLWLTIPFIRNVRELYEIKRIIVKEGLHRSPSFKLWMNVGIPANVIEIEKYLEVGIDGIVIDLQQLTMLLTATDPENDSVRHEFNDQDSSVLWSIQEVVKKAQKQSVHVAILLKKHAVNSILLKEFLTWGIETVIVPPETVSSAKQKIVEIERKLLS